MHFCLELFDPNGCPLFSSHHLAIVSEVYLYVPPCFSDSIELTFSSICCCCFCLTFSFLTLSLRLIPSIFFALLLVLVCLRFFLLMWWFLDRKLRLGSMQAWYTLRFILMVILESLNKIRTFQKPTRSKLLYCQSPPFDFSFKLYFVSKAQGICTDLRFLLFGFELPNVPLLDSFSIVLSSFRYVTTLSPAAHIGPNVGTNGIRPMCGPRKTRWGQYWPQCVEPG